MDPIFARTLQWRLQHIISDLEHLENEAHEEIEEELERLHAWLDRHHHRHHPVPPTTQATRLTLTIEGATNMATTFTIDTVGGVANLQFTDDHGNNTPGPNDSVTGAPIVPRSE